MWRALNRFYGLQDFPYLKLEIRDLNAKSGRDSGLKVRAGGVMPTITLGITELHEILSRDYGIEGPYWGPSMDARKNGAWEGLKRYASRLIIPSRELQGCINVVVLNKCQMNKKERIIYEFEMDLKKIFLLTFQSK